MFAAYGDHQSCVKELLANGADLSLENSNLDTAYDISVKRRCKESMFYYTTFICMHSFVVEQNNLIFLFDSFTVQSIIEKHILNSLGSG